MQYRKLGINAINGEAWDESGLQTVCSELGDLKCIEAKTYTLEAVSVKSKEHFVQNAIVGRFQEYSADFLEGKRETELIDLSLIDKVPIWIFASKLDFFCTHAQATEDALKIGDMVKYFETVWSGDHFYFVTENSKEWLDKLDREL